MGYQSGYKNLFIFLRYFFWTLPTISNLKLSYTSHRITLSRLLEKVITHAWAALLILSVPRQTNVLCSRGIPFFSITSFSSCSHPMKRQAAKTAWSWGKPFLSLSRKSGLIHTSRLEYWSFMNGILRTKCTNSCRLLSEISAGSANNSFVASWLLNRI